MRKTLWLFSVLAWAFTAGCLPPGPPAAPLPPQTPEQRAWFAARDAQPEAFTLPADRGDAAWTRGKLWLASYSDFKLQIVDTEILETYSPPSEIAARFGFQVTRQKVENGSWRFNVKCFSGNPYAGNVAIAKAKGLAYYMATGIDCPGCGGGKLGTPNQL